MRAQHAVDARSLAHGGQPDGYAMREEPLAQAGRVLADRNPRIAPITPYAQKKPREHDDCAKQPHPREHGADCQVSRDANADVIEAAQLRRPRDTCSPEAIEESAERHDEIERCRYPDPILPGGVPLPERCQNPGCEADD